MAETKFLVITIMCYSVVTVVVLTVCCCAFWRYKKNTNRPNKSRKSRFSGPRIKRPTQTPQEMGAGPITTATAGANLQHSVREASEPPYQPPGLGMGYCTSTPYMGSSYNRGDFPPGNYVPANPQAGSFLPGNYPPGGVYGMPMPPNFQVPLTMAGGLPPSLSRRQSIGSDNGGSDTYRDTSQYTGDEFSDVLSSRGDAVDREEVICEKL